MTTIEAAKPFFIAEDYHQDFYKKDPARYKASSQLRKDWLEEVWGEDSDEA